MFCFSQADIRALSARPPSAFSGGIRPTARDGNVFAKASGSQAAIAKSGMMCLGRKNWEKRWSGSSGWIM